MSVSAIIPTYNRLGYIRRAIDSVLAQTVPVDEVFVVDDGSTDGTAAVVEAEYGESARMIRQANTGISGARRRGVEEACGEWIAFLDSDDEWTPNHIKDLLDAAGKVPEDVAWIFGDLRWVADDGRETTLFQKSSFSVTECPLIFPDSSVFLGPVPCWLQASLIRRRVILELDGFHEGLRSWEDSLLAYQVASRYKFAAIPFVVTSLYRTTDLAGSSLSSRRASSSDCFHSRMMSYSAVIKSGRVRPWNKYYAGEVRAFCRWLADSGQPVPRSLALQQFRYGAFSAKEIAFFCAAMFGRRGIQLCDSMAKITSSGKSDRTRPESL
jgi:glycosyltransferase involved in cell wall biosynthesis